MTTQIRKSSALVSLPQVRSSRGTLTALQNSIDLPFDIKRVFYIYDVPDGETRGGHAHHQLQELIVAVSGSLDVLTDDGLSATTFALNRSYMGLYIPPMTWRHLGNFATGTVCLVLASEFYCEEDYIRDYGEFCRLMGRPE
jgi:dTDP-4-dehydrorhamnose 3,5-epimerase-like enzyme